MHMAYLADKYANEGLKVVSVFPLFNIKHLQITYEQLVHDLLEQGFPDYLYNAVIFLDELQIVCDSYNFNSKETRAFTKLVTQLRKLKSTMYWSTQIFSMVALRVRAQTNFIIQLEPSVTKGVSKVSVFDYMGHDNGIKGKNFIFDGRPYFNRFDTNWVISYDPHDPIFNDDDEEE